MPTKDRTYPIAERFFAPQGEGLLTGVPTAFIRFVGCSVGKTVCEHCDTAFEAVQTYMGGGHYTADQLIEWVDKYEYVCLTGGEPLDRDLLELILALTEAGNEVQIETSGTKHPDWLDLVADIVHLTVSPKPGWREDVIALATEIKVILGGLGEGPGWPTVLDAKAWAHTGKPVYVQPRNHVHTVSNINLRKALDVVAENPELRVSVQLHKFIGTR